MLKVIIWTQSPMKSRIIQTNPIQTLIAFGLLTVPIVKTAQTAQTVKAVSIVSTVKIALTVSIAWIVSIVLVALAVSGVLVALILRTVAPSGENRFHLSEMKLHIIAFADNQTVTSLLYAKWFTASNIVRILCVFFAPDLTFMGVDLLLSMNVVSMSENPTVNLFNQHYTIAVWTLDIHF